MKSSSHRSQLQVPRLSKTLRTRFRTLQGLPLCEPEKKSTDNAENSKKVKSYAKIAQDRSPEVLSEAKSLLKERRPFMRGTGSGETCPLTILIFRGSSRENSSHHRPT